MHQMDRTDAEDLPTDDEIAEYRETFALFDKNGDGTLTAEELSEGLRSLGQSTRQEDLASLIREANEDGKGSIDFTEFVVMMHRRSKAMNRENELKEAFKLFDVNGDGIISQEELREAMTKMGVQMTDEEVTDMVREADANGDGVITYEEFVAMIKWRPTLLSGPTARTHTNGI